MAEALWVREFGWDYDVPPEVLALVQSGEAEDISWHNDICPSFSAHGPDYSPEVRLWVEHPDPAKREWDDAKRFGVSVATQTPGSEFDDFFDTDDAGEAVRKYREFVKKHVDPALGKTDEATWRQTMGHWRGRPETDPHVMRLASSAALGDEDAATEIRDKYDDVVRRIAVMAAQEREEPLTPSDLDELADDVWERVFAAMERYHPARAEFEEWLFDVSSEAAKKAIGKPVVRRVRSMIPAGVPDLRLVAVPAEEGRKTAEAGERGYRATIVDIAQEVVDQYPDPEKHHNERNESVFERVDGSSWVIYIGENEEVLKNTDNEPDDREVAAMAGPKADWRQMRTVAAFLAMEADVWGKIRELDKNRELSGAGGDEEAGDSAESVADRLGNVRTNIADSGKD